MEKLIISGINDADAYLMRGRGEEGRAVRYTLYSTYGQQFIILKSQPTLNLPLRKKYFGAKMN